MSCQSSARLLIGSFAFRRWLQDVLRRKGLPTEDRLYVCKDDGSWKIAESSDTGSPQCGLRGLVERLGFEIDSAVGYAARIINISRFLVGAIKRGDAQAAAMFGYEIGFLIAESTFKFRWERSALHGIAMRGSHNNIDGHNQQTRAAKAPEWARWAAEAERLRRAHPSWRRIRIARRVKSKLKLTGPGTSERSILRHIKIV